MAYMSVTHRVPLHRVASDGGISLSVTVAFRRYLARRIESDFSWVVCVVVLLHCRCFQHAVIGLRVLQVAL